MKDISHHKKKLQKKVIGLSKKSERLHMQKKSRIKMISRGYTLMLALDSVIDHLLPDSAVEYYEGASGKNNSQKKRTPQIRKRSHRT